ncbi:MAG: NHL repeat-containing protein [Pirellulaceae bacterium]
MSRFALLLIVCLPALSGCIDVGTSEGYLETVWGRHGVSDGRFVKPRAIAIDDQDQLYIVDMTARIQVFDRDGNWLRSWQTPEFLNGKPSGLSFDNQGRLLVADTHYFRMLVYTPQGELLEKFTIGGENGHLPGQFEFVTDAVQDSRGNYYISAYGEYDRIQKYSPEGKFLLQWGGHGVEPGEFIRPQSLDIDENDHLWVADACNHRIQVFDATGDEAKLVKMWGEQGTEPGTMRYPYDLQLDGQGHLYVCEFGNHRVQKFTLDGQFVAAWGVGGREEGQLYSPWALARDSQGSIHVVDSYNHRIQRIRL